ncbi:MAG: hypothetical protein PHR81_01190 [Bacteroidales bacterium]|jgi:hypothetical protein|nr:hypothetical protein [Bacteroidales bacterium]MDD4213405.1 hypothetical protein [Bacteroidales bacterium]
MNTDKNELTIAEIILKTLIIMKRYLVLILIFLVIGLVLGYLLVGNKVTTYKNVCVLSTIDKVPFGLIRTVSEPLLKPSGENVTEFFSSELSVDKAIANNIINIFIDSLVKSDNRYFKVVFTLKDSSENNEFIQGYIKYLTQSAGISKIITENTEANKKMLDNINKKLFELEDLHKKTSGNSGVLISGDSYKVYIDLLEMKQLYASKLQNDSTFHVIDKKVTSMVKTPSRSLSVVKYVLASLFTAFIIIFIIEMIKRIKSIK